MGTVQDSGAAVVFTTHERSGYFTAILPDDVDMRFTRDGTLPFEDELHNIVVAGGSLAIIDEAHFPEPDDMALGLERFVRRQGNARRLKIIVMSTERQEGDMLLAFLVTYCGIFNIVYGMHGVNVVAELNHLLAHDNTWEDVMDLADAYRWETAKEMGAWFDARRAQADARSIGTVLHVPVRLEMRDFMIDAREAVALMLHIEVTALYE